MLCDVVVRRRRRRRRRRWAHAPVIHAASHFDQKKRVAWVSISMHTCGSFFYNYGAPLGVTCDHTLPPLYLDAVKEGMIHLLVGSYVKKPDSGVFSDWSRNNAYETLRSYWLTYFNLISGQKVETEARF